MYENLLDLRNLESVLCPVAKKEEIEVGRQISLNIIYCQQEKKPGYSSRETCPALIQEVGKIRENSHQDYRRSQRRVELQHLQNKITDALMYHDP